MNPAGKRRTILWTCLSVLILTLAMPVLSQQSPEQLYREATAAYDRGDVTQAISLYQQLLKLQPNSVAAHTELGVALAHEGRYTEAVEQYKQALRHDPENVATKLDLALAWYKQAAFEKAVSELESLRAIHPENRQSLYLLADCYLRLGRNREVIALLDSAHQADPGDLAVSYALGTALIRDGRISQGEQVLDPILKKTDSPEANLLMGEAQFAAGDYQAAAASLRKSVERNPQIAEAWSLYGRTLLHNEDPNGAKDAFHHALQLDLNDFFANLYMASVLRSEAKTEQAVPYADRALQVRPTSPEARFEVAALDASLGKLESARRRFEDLEREWPDFIEVHVQLAALYARLNLKEQSEHERDMVLKLDKKARDEASPRRNP